MDKIGNRHMDDENNIVHTHLMPYLPHLSNILRVKHPDHL